MKTQFQNVVSLGHILAAFPVLMALGGWAIHTENRMATTETTLAHVEASIHDVDQRNSEATADIRQTLRDIQAKLDAALMGLLRRDHAANGVRP